LDALQQLLQRLPDHRSLDTLDVIRHKTDILPIGIEKEKILKLSANYKRDNTLPVLLWNHRWEHDKRPDLFVQLCTNLRKEGKKFKINFIGKSSGQCADLLQKFKHDFQDDILNWGHVDSYDAYLKILMSSDILPVCSEHDFFGIAVLEGMYAGNTPILPAGMVYEEHFTSDPSDYLYNGFDGLAERCLAAINKRDSFDPGLLKDYNKTKVISMYDRFFEGCVL
jgi:glycosyltransferase involved in cell wall biosynthesis